MEKSFGFEPLSGYVRPSQEEMKDRAQSFFASMRARRTVRHFSDQAVPESVIADCLRAAGTAPNGANKQPWHFVVVADPALKSEIRKAAEEEEVAFYAHRAPQEWLDALTPFGTDAEKPFLETAPFLIAIFAERFGVAADGSKSKNYYVQESVGIATGILITAIHQAGLVSLTHTPSPMGFLNTLLHRPSNEHPFLLLVVGYPAADAMVPVLPKKSLAEIATFL